MSLGVCFKKVARHQSWHILLDTASKICIISGVWFERRKVEKKANLHES